ncbi:hypothetical protein TsFJ059_008686 [Trichoderma semiorbis]|uniref:Uncharacterized protein n=2 Tax=Trichoderma TaxID=5543 RepID=A0A9W9B658_9HYPO|nr:hypothetical protein T069G_08140 [Trichoderma breve]KAH0523719.1 hypothetical protein TsFJ059_008686 [Trichoderma semiorbis]KAJ4857243.1 hypothetical protein T069G_08140 [Trichoderma breve]KAK4069063.1 hypothetical protein Trihar35433_5642 [Trichoderma harzianum]
MHDLEDSTLHKIEKGWSIATNCAEQRLKRICGWTDDEFSLAMQQGLVMLETVCTFVHGGVKSGQYKLPVDFWKMLVAEYGIVVYPSALTECLAPSGLGSSQTFTEIYSEHIVMLGKRDSSRPPLCPFEYLKEPLPVYEK